MRKFAVPFIHVSLRHNDIWTAQAAKEGDTTKNDLDWNPGNVSTKEAILSLAKHVIGDNVTVLNTDTGENIETGQDYRWDEYDGCFAACISCEWCGGGYYNVYTDFVPKDGMRAEAARREAAEAAEKKEKRETAFAEAKKTGTKQLLYQGMCDCRDPEEIDCSFDSFGVYAMPDGTTKTYYTHCY